MNIIISYSSVLMSCFLESILWFYTGTIKSDYSVKWLMLYIYAKQVIANSVQDHFMKKEEKVVETKFSTINQT